MARLNASGGSGKPERTSRFLIDDGSDPEIISNDAPDAPEPGYDRFGNPIRTAEVVQARPRPPQRQPKPAAATEKAKRRRRRNYYVAHLKREYHKRKASKVRPILIPSELLEGYSLQALLTRYWFLAMVNRAMLEDRDAGSLFAFSATCAAEPRKSLVRDIVRDVVPGPVWRDLSGMSQEHRRRLFQQASRRLVELKLIERRGKGHKTRYRIANSRVTIPV